MQARSLLHSFFLVTLIFLCTSCESPAEAEKKAIRDVLARDAKFSASVAELRGLVGAGDVQAILRDSYEDRRGLITAAQGIKSAGSGDTEKLVAFLKLENLYCETLFEAGQVKAAAGFSGGMRPWNRYDYQAEALVNASARVRNKLIEAEPYWIPFGWQVTWAK